MKAHLRTPSAAESKLATALEEQKALQTRLSELVIKIQAFREIVGDEKRAVGKAAPVSFERAVPHTAPEIKSPNLGEMPVSLTDAALWVVDRYGRETVLTSGEVKKKMEEHGYKYGGAHFSQGLLKTLTRLGKDRIDAEKKNGNWLFRSKQPTLWQSNQAAS